jgi:hypothetical protein
MLSADTVFPRASLHLDPDRTWDDHERGGRGTKQLAVCLDEQRHVAPPTSSESGASYGKHRQVDEDQIIVRCGLRKSGIYSAQ